MRHLDLDTDICAATPEVRMSMQTAFLLWSGFFTENVTSVSTGRCFEYAVPQLVLTFDPVVDMAMDTHTRGTDMELCHTPPMSLRFRPDSMLWSSTSLRLLEVYKIAVAFQVLSNSQQP